MIDAVAAIAAMGVMTLLESVDQGYRMAWPLIGLVEDVFV